MAASGRVKTTVPRACSTLDGHSEVKQLKKRYTCFPASIGHTAWEQGYSSGSYSNSNQIIDGTSTES